MHETRVDRDIQLKIATWGRRGGGRRTFLPRAGPPEACAALRAGPARLSGRCAPGRRPERQPSTTAAEGVCGAARRRAGPAARATAKRAGPAARAPAKGVCGAARGSASQRRVRRCARDRRGCAPGRRPERQPKACAALRAGPARLRAGRCARDRRGCAPAHTSYHGGDWCWAVKRRDDEASGGALSCRAPGRRRRVRRCRRCARDRCGSAAAARRAGGPSASLAQRPPERDRRGCAQGWRPELQPLQRRRLVLGSEASR